jgi:hypothetical protein
MKRKHSFFYRNGLTLVLILLFFGSFTGQILTGFSEHNNELADYGKPAIVLSKYFATGHFLQTTFENWESEFLQMGMYVLLTISLRQAGSSESKDLDEKEPVDRKPNPSKPDAPWPVRKGGLVLLLYKNSLSMAFILLFVVSFALHAKGSLENFNEEQLLMRKPAVDMGTFMTQSRFWFESFQNWQSEFVAVISIVALSIFLRQHGSPESKPVDASDSETGSG